MLHQIHLRAMNTEVGIWLWQPAAQAAERLRQASQRFTAIEAELSRFRPDSGLSRLNAAAGSGPQPVLPLLWTVLTAALEAARRSDGLFDPTLLHALRRAGYDRSFEQLPPPSPAAPAAPAALDWGYQRVRTDPAAMMVELPAGLGLDLGGIGKGWAVDDVAQTLAAHGPVLVDAGGDMRIVGAVRGEPWPIAVQNPFHAQHDLFTLAVSSGAVATSSIGGRRWASNGRAMHHLLDPRTGQPSVSDLHSVTVLAPTAASAEVAAKVALILGSRQGSAYLAKRNLRGLLIGREGQQQTVGRLPLSHLNPRPTTILQEYA
ncbi:MAG: FAD:protein FMN transferase [Anaerolineae bacterium]